MREVRTHKVNGCNEAISIHVLDDPGAGGAHHHYRLGLCSPPGVAPGITGRPLDTDIHFQNGPIKEAGTNGLTHEALLAVVADRLECFQAGPYACEENAQALTKVREAMHWLHHRTLKRVARGVEGTHQK